MIVRAGLLVLSLAAIAQGAPRVIGGHNAPNHKYPYLVSMRDSSTGEHMCGGSILNERWILTAAHCLDSYRVGRFHFVAGTNFLNETGTVLKPDLAVIPDAYTWFDHNDIAMVRVDKDIIFTDFVKPIKLPSEDLKDYSRPADFAGWGKTNLTGPGNWPNALQELSFNVITNEDCKKDWEKLTERHICALNKYDEGICMADSGGPLVVDGVQVGIASYIRPCAINHPDVYTRVFSYRDWILENIEFHTPRP